jgi:ATP synthase protein I
VSGDEPEDRQRSRRVLGRIVQRKAERRLQARREGDRGVWFGLGMMGMVGWAVAIPTLAGIAIGIWLDRRFPSGYSWTLTGLGIGIVLGCLNAWMWINRESRMP